MATELREVRRDDIQTALAFAGEHGGVTARAGLRHELSLLARDEQGQTIGAALLHVPAGQPPVLRIALTPALPDEGATLLIDKALLKAQAQHFGRIRVVILDPDRAQSLWAAQDFLQRSAQDDAA